MENKRENNRTWSYDEIDYRRFNELGIAELGRLYHDLPSRVKDDHTRIPLPIVAKGITAFLADGSMTSFLNVIYFGLQVVDAEVFFDEYYKHCMEFLKINDRRKSPLKYKWKSDNELINEHLKTEKEIFEEPQIFYNEYREQHGEIIETIKETALYYPEWVKKAYLKDEAENSTPEPSNYPNQKPIFRPEAIQAIFDILKDFFHLDSHLGLKQILETGNDVSKPLIFLDNGNRLADAFKQLIKADIITGCEQIQLENWIFKNFKYIHRGQIKNYTQNYLNDIISTNKDKCQKPILNVRLDKSTGIIFITKS